MPRLHDSSEYIQSSTQKSENTAPERLDYLLRNQKEHISDVYVYLKDAINNSAAGTELT